MEAEVRIEAIDHHSPHLEAVIALGRANAKTLGPMPKGGFVDYAVKRHIIVALSSQNECVGYLMYRVAYQRASIVHLCIDKAWRGKHIAQMLVNELIQVTRDLYGIRLSCRREVVYYRSAWNSGGLVAPGRILWYVSQGRKAGHYYQAKSIRACSNLDEIIVDTPKNLFHQFRRLGIYIFNDVLKTANNDF